MKGRFFLVLLLVLSSISDEVHAQNTGHFHIDSLLQELQKAKDDTNKIKILDYLSYYYEDINQGQGLKYGQQELQLATKLNWQKGIAMSDNSLGDYYESKSDYPKALEYYQDALRVYEVAGAQKVIVNTYVRLARVYQQLSDYSKALEYYLKSAKIYEDTGDKSKLAITYGDIGGIYNERSDYPNAIEYYQKAIKIYLGTGDKFNVAVNESNIGNIYFNKSDFPPALDYHFKSLKIYEESGQANNIAYEYQIIGNIYMEMEYYPTAIQYEQMSLKIAEESENRVLEAYVLAAIGNAYVSMVQDNIQTIKNKKSAGKYMSEGSIPESKADRLQLAEYNLEHSLSIASKMHITQLVEFCYETLSEAYNLDGNFDKANEYDNNYHAAIDSVYAKEYKEKIADLELKNQYDQKHLEDSLKTKNQQKIAAIKLNRQRSYLLVAVCFSLFVMVFIILIYFNYRRIRGLHKKVSIQKTELEKSNQDKERILQIVAHDLRSPVGSISYICDLMMMGDRTEKEVLESMKMIKNASLGSLELINELVGQIDNGKSPNKKSADIGSIIMECVAMLGFKVKEKQQSIITNIPGDPIFILVNREKIMRAINNLLGNAVKFSHEKQVIEITLAHDAANVIITIKDNGIGIPENMKQEVFDIFTDSKRYGTLGEKPFGLGLYISRQIIEAHGGTITFESKEGEETVFYIRLPKNAA